jgi:hypothetical protein
MHLNYPFAGSRMLRNLLSHQGLEVGRHLSTLMRRMGIEAIYRKPNTSKPTPGHLIFRICWAVWPSHGPTRSGRWTSLTSPWRVASSIWRRWWTGSVAAYWHGDCQSSWDFLLHRGTGRSSFHE